MWLSHRSLGLIISINREQQELSTSGPWQPQACPCIQVLFTGKGESDKLFSQPGTSYLGCPDACVFYPLHEPHIHTSFYISSDIIQLRRLSAPHRFSLLFPMGENAKSYLHQELIIQASFPKIRKLWMMTLTSKVTMINTFNILQFIVLQKLKYYIYIYAQPINTA